MFNTRICRGFSLSINTAINDTLEGKDPLKILVISAVMVYDSKKMNEDNTTQSPL